MASKYVPKTVLLKLEEKSKRYDDAKIQLSKELEKNSSPAQLEFAAAAANTAWLELKHAQQLVNNYLGKHVYG